MRFAVLGAGGMGAAAAYDLARQPGVSIVRLVDRSEDALARARGLIQPLLSRDGLTTQLEFLRADLADVRQLPPLFAGIDVALVAASYDLNLELTRQAIAARVHLCDLGGNNEVVQAQLALGDEAAARGVTIIPDCGLAPGLAGWLGALGADRLTHPAAIRMRVGGLPVRPEGPLSYQLVFSARGLVNEYLEPAEILRQGELREVSSLTEVEHVAFPLPWGTLECFHTSGGASTLPRTLRSRVRDIEYKTLRYPGHCRIIRALAELGFFSETPVNGVAPRGFSEALLERSLAGDGEDAVLLRVEVAGRGAQGAGQWVFQLVDRLDPATGFTAMARTTAFPAAAVAYFLGTGVVSARGAHPAELVLPLEKLLQSIRARGIAVEERWEPGTAN